MPNILNLYRFYFRDWHLEKSLTLVLPLIVYSPMPVLSDNLLACITTLSTCRNETIFFWIKPFFVQLYVKVCDYFSYELTDVGAFGFFAVDPRDPIRSDRSLIGFHIVGHQLTILKTKLVDEFLNGSKSASHYWMVIFKTRSLCAMENIEGFH